MKITKKQLRHLIREAIGDSRGELTVPHLVVRGRNSNENDVIFSLEDVEDYHPELLSLVNVITRDVEMVRGLPYAHQPAQVADTNRMIDQLNRKLVPGR